MRFASRVRLGGFMLQHCGDSCCFSFLLSLFGGPVAAQLYNGDEVSVSKFADKDESVDSFPAKELMELLSKMKYVGNLSKQDRAHVGNHPADGVVERVLGLCGVGASSCVWAIGFS